MSATRPQETRLLGRLFEERGHWVARQEVARASDLPVDALETCLALYREVGYPLEFHPLGGIRMQEPPDIWCAEEIVGRCPVLENGPIAAWDPLLLAETASTNDVVRDHARKGARAGFVVAASRQTRGRGRMGRAWESPAEKGLYVSLLLRPEWTMQETGRLPILSSVAAADAVESVSGLRPRIKWPNDLQIGGCKLAGLLIEAEPVGAKLAFAVVGIGINVRQTAEDFPLELSQTATSLLLATGQLYRRADLLVALLQAMDRRLREPFETTRQAWEASSLTLGQQVALMTARGRKPGQAVGLDESGALLLRNDAGEVETITAGDMSEIRT